MNILYIASSFPKPEISDTIYTDLAEELRNKNHLINVIVFDEHIKHSYIGYERNIIVLRVRVNKYYNSNLLKKAITMLSLPYLFKKEINKHFNENHYDIVLFEAPPVTYTNIVKWVMDKFNCKSYLMQKDIFPQNAVDLKLLNKLNPIYFYFRYLEKKMLKISTWIGCMSQKNIDYLLQHNKNLNKIKFELFPNTKKIIKTIKSFNDTEKEIIHEKFKIPKKCCIFIIGGNLGRPQYVELLCKTIFHFKYDNDKFFIFVGRGTDIHKIENLIKNNSIKNSLVINSLSRKDYEEILNISDIGLITLHPDFTIPNYPSRILSYMEYSKPVIAATDGNTDFKDLIINSKCGLWSESSNHIDFYKNIEILSNNHKTRLVMGSNGRKYLEEKFNVSRSVEILENHFKGV